MKKTKFIAAALAVLFVFNAYAIPRSKAVVIDATAAFGAAAATAAINGTTATTLFTGMGTSAATGSVIGLMDTYAAATGVAASGTALASSIATGILVSGGVLLVGVAAAALIGGFLDWLQTEKGLEAGGGNMPVFSDLGFRLADGTLASLSTDIPYTSGWYKDTTFNGTLFPIGTDVEFMSGARISFTDDGTNSFVVTLYGSGGTRLAYSGSFSGNGFVTLYINGAGYLGYAIIESVPSDTIAQYWHFVDTKKSPDLFSSVSDEAFIVQPLPEFQEIPQEIPEGQVLKINTGIESLSADDHQAAADAIMQTAIDGDLNPIVSVENDPTVTPDPDPDPEPLPPPGDLPQNLPELGDVLISRFPFSIPWDIGRVLDFLSSEPVAPHIEYQPFKGDLFGIPADSVSVDYDFSKHEDIASFCRTFEIVGFCLLLAVGTKRLIWTA